ncbi:MAG: hypothetical protein R3B84_10255 [Zavarzinella sp.]
MGNRTQFIVRQRNWLYVHEKVFARAPGERVIAHYENAADAEADCLQRESAVRAQWNPFWFGTTLHHLTTFPIPILRDWLQDAGLSPPDSTDIADWAKWYEELPRSPEQTHHLWQGLNRLQFHDVVARDPDKTAYAIMEIVWSYDDQYYHAAHEGGKVQKVYRNREAADQECQRLISLYRQQMGLPHRGTYSRNHAEALKNEYSEIERIRLENQLPPYEVVEIDVE